MPSYHHRHSTEGLRSGHTPSNGVQWWEGSPRLVMQPWLGVHAGPLSLGACGNLNHEIMGALRTCR